MAVEGIANLAPYLVNQYYGQTTDTQAANGPGTVNPAIGTVTDDTFTPSTQNNSAQATAQDAGIFQVNQSTLTTAGANPVFAAAAPSEAQAPAAPTPAATTAATTPPLSANSNTPANAPPPTSTAEATAEVQNKLRALNAALPALGLTNEQIQQIDRIASLVQNFNPAAYQNLVSQYEAQTEQAEQQSPGVPASGTGTTSVATAPINAGANVNGYQVQSTSANFPAPQGTPAANAGNGSGTAPNSNPQNSASPQTGQVQFTPSITTGQAAKAPGPQQRNAAGNPPGNAT